MKSKTEKLCQHPITKEYFMVSDYKDLGNGHFIAQNKRKATKEEIDAFEKEGDKDGN